MTEFEKLQLYNWYNSRIYKKNLERVTYIELWFSPPNLTGI